MEIAVYSDDMENEFEVNDIVKPANEHDARVLQSGFTQRITEHTKFKVCVVVRDATTYRGKNESGIIVAHIRGRDNMAFCYPYVWDVKRFVKA